MSRLGPGRVRRALQRRRQAARLWAIRHGYAGSRGFESRLVWILGSPRSGSTWLLRLLAEHESVVPVDEPLIGNYLGAFMCDSPGMQAPDLDLTNCTLARLRSDTGPSFFSQEFRDVWVPLLGRFIRARVLAQAIKRPSSAPLSRTLVVAKEPNGSQSADMIMAALPRARLLFLLRDGRDVVDSDLAGSLEGSWVSNHFSGFRGIGEEERLDFVMQSAHKWLWRTEVVEEAFRSHDGPKLLIRYEDLLNEPRGELRSVFEWLDLAIGDEELNGVVERHSFEEIPAPARGSQQFFRSANPGFWRENLSPEEHEAMVSVIGEKLRELGYED